MQIVSSEALSSETESEGEMREEGRGEKRRMELMREGEREESSATGGRGIVLVLY